MASCVCRFAMTANCPALATPQRSHSPTPTLHIACGQKSVWERNGVILPGQAWLHVGGHRAPPLNMGLWLCLCSHACPVVSSLLRDMSDAWRLSSILTTWLWHCLYLLMAHRCRVGWSTSGPRRGKTTPSEMSLFISLWHGAHCTSALEHSRKRSNMANILTADLPSDDEQDDDFDPAQDGGGSDTEKKRSAASRKRRRFGARQPADEPGVEDAEEASY